MRRRVLYQKSGNTGNRAMVPIVSQLWDSVTSRPGKVVTEMVTLVTKW